MLRPISCCACGLFITLLASAGAAPIADPVGVWRLKCIPPDGKPRQCVVTVSREGRALKGTYSAEGVTRPVEGIAFDEGELRVRVNGDFGGQTYRLTYTGRPAGDTLTGSVRWSYGILGGSFPFEGRRIGQQVASPGK
jgi:hypothetical protein